MRARQVTHVALLALGGGQAKAARYWGVMVVGVMIAGCWDRPYIETGIAGLEKFSSAEALKGYVAEQVEAARYWRGGEFGIGVLPMGGVAAPMPAMESSASDEQSGFSTTNLQEEGVDESDVVKTDGTYLYIVGTDGVRIVQVVPADDMKIVSTVEVEGRPRALYLRGDRLVVLTDPSSRFDPEEGLWVMEARWPTAVIVDVADRSSPQVKGTVELEGSLLTSRMVESKLHLVLLTRPTLPADGGSDAIRQANVDDLIPDVTVIGGDGERQSRNVVAWQDLYYPVDADGYAVTAVVTVDVDSPGSPVQSLGVMADAGTVYASPEALYLTDPDYDPAGQYRETTDIYKFDLKGEGARLAAAGTVPGRLLNRFSLGEHEGYLRAATTEGQVWRWGGSDARNNVYVLGPEENELTIVGRIEGIAPGEQIYSARFVGDRGFLVTFKKVDPLYTLALSDPTAPRVVGTLKVEGYSDYIHLLGENHLLTIGKDAVDMGDFAWYQGVQLSVFDVTDFASPQRVDVEVVGDRGTESEALHEPHAFNYFAATGTLAVPMDISEGSDDDPSSYGVPTFQGLCLYRVTPSEGIEALGRIATDTSGRYSYSGSWTRGIFIGETVYAVTESSVQAVPLADLSAAPVTLALE